MTLRAPRLLPLFTAAATALFVAPPARADLSGYAVDSVVALGQFDGKDYVQVVGRMMGTVAQADGSVSTYAVPSKLSFPADSTNCNGFGVVEPLHQASGPASLSYIGTDYMFGNGYVHFAFAWDKNHPNSRIGTTSGITGPVSDGWAIIADATALVRNPAAFLSGVQPAPCGASQIIGFGLSRTGMLLRGFLDSSRNQPGYFDGVLLTIAGGLCLELGSASSAYVPCAGPLPEDGKVLAVNSEHDVERFQGWLARAETPSFRLYEVAGIPHIAKSSVDFTALGATRQNPVNQNPVYRAMLAHLADWLDRGVEPPAGVTLPGEVVDPPAGDLVPRLGCTISPCPIYQFVRDQYGNATGGVRLPHVAVPIGSYTGVEADLANIAPMFRQTVSFGGTFTPFSPETLSQMYPDHGEYVSQIADAANDARNSGYILEDDAALYKTQGANSIVGMPPAGDDSAENED